MDDVLNIASDGAATSRSSPAISELSGPVDLKHKELLATCKNSRYEFENPSTGTNKLLVLESWEGQTARETGVGGSKG